MTGIPGFHITRAQKKLEDMLATCKQDIVDALNAFANESDANRIAVESYRTKQYLKWMHSNAAQAFVNERLRWERPNTSHTLAVPVP